MRMTVTRSSGNVFKDLGFRLEQAEHLRVRAELMVSLQKAISARRLLQSETARRLGVTQPRVSDLMRGRIDLFSADALIDMLARLGMSVKVTLRPSRRRARVA